MLGRLGGYSNHPLWSEVFFRVLLKYVRLYWHYSSKFRTIDFGAVGRTDILEQVAGRGRLPNFMWWTDEDWMEIEPRTQVRPLDF